jgi:signal transduction histidine kinase
MSIKGYFLGVTGILVAAAVTASAITVMYELRSLGEATTSRTMTIAFKETLEAIDALRRERGTSNIMLMSPGADVDAAAYRKSTDTQFDEVDAALQATDSTQGTLILRDVAAARRTIAALRSRVDQALADPTSPENDAFRQHYFEVVSKLIDRLDGTAAQLEVQASDNASPRARNLLEITRLAASMRSLAGLRAMRGDRLVAVHNENPAILIDQLGDLAGRIDGVWQRIQELARPSTAVEVDDNQTSGHAIATAVEATRHGYVDTIGLLYEQIIGARRMGAAINMGPTEIYRANMEGLGYIATIRDAAAAEAIAAATQTQHSSRLQLAFTSGLLLIVAIVAMGSILVLQWRILHPMSTLTGTLFRLANNDRALEVPELRRRDEVGDLARAIETLRQNAENADKIERERQSIEVQLRQAQKLEALGTLAGGIAHEINTPAQYVGDNLRFLDDSFKGIGQFVTTCTELCSASESELAGSIKEAAAAVDFEFLSTEIPTAITQSLDGVDRIRQIVLAVKDFSHPDVKEATPLDLNQAIHTTLTVSRNQWKYVAEAITDLAPNLPHVPCRGGEINQVLLNLIVNAAHAIEAKGTGMGEILVQTQQCGDLVEIRVSDTGTGIPAELLDRIFDPFFTTKEPGKGTGQGLAICHTIVVTKHGGSIAVESTPGEGSTFIVRLPLQAPSGSNELGLAA